MTKVRQITAKMLAERGTCEVSVRLFRKAFPRGTPRTPGGFLRAAERVAHLFNWNAAAYRLLPKQLRIEYEMKRAALRAEYERQVGPSWAEYQRQMALLFARLWIA